MWSKGEQVLLWIITYIPLVLIMVFRFIVSNNFLYINDFVFNIKNIQFYINPIMIELFFVVFTLVVTFILYKITINYLLSGYEKKLKPGSSGQNYSIRKIEVLSVNDYSFFLLTLLLPLVSLDHSSIINLSVSILIIIYVVSIYVKTDAISVCPLFFFSGRKVYKGIISEGTKEAESKNPLLRKEVIMVLKEENLTLDKKMRGEELVGNVFYLTSIRK